MTSYSIGEKFNHLKVLSVHHKRQTPNGTWKIYVTCKCDCGNECVKQLNTVRNGHVKSCGCKFSENMRKLPLNSDRLYNIYNQMKGRCYNNRQFQYKNYGKRGIKMCNEWKDDFKAFYDWAISNGYQDNLTIDRIDVNGNYEPSNCRWVSNRENSWNKRNSRFLYYNGVRYCFSEFCYKFGIKNRAKAYYRYYNTECTIHDLFVMRDNGEFNKEVT